MTTEDQPIQVSQTFTQLAPDKTYSAHETGVQEYWDEIDLPTLLKQKDENSKPFNFMDGPPFVSGSLHYGHLAVGSYKSAVCNAMGMMGFDSAYIPGFDCHGLPIESAVSKAHSLTSEKVDEMGIEKFNRLCDQMITDVSDSWKPLFKKFGRIADFNNVYMTRDLNFMESTIWIFKQLYDKDLVYSGNKVMPYSYALETPLSNFEAGQNYQDVATKSIYVRFKVKSPLPDGSDTDTYFVAWTTTPWTLPSNLALCVNAQVDYVLVEDLEDSSVRYILSKNSLANLYGKKRVSKVKVLAEYKGKDLENLHYEPLFPYMENLNEKLGRDNGVFFKILCDPYVKDSGIGTAIVHQAPAFGEDDFRVCAKYNMVDNVTLSDYCPIDSKCKYTPVISDYEGVFVFDADDGIRSSLSSSGHLIKVQEYQHSYPHCYRSDTPLVYRTVRSFFIKLEPLKDRMIELNKTVTWHPEEIGSNRFGTWLENAKDWAVSRFRYYGTPIPIWVNDEDPNDMLCVGSIEELAQLAGVSTESIQNLHPEHVNGLKIEKDGKTYSRVPDIFDCWFESGAVPFAQIHYPFDAEKARVLEESAFLSDFICEGLDQTRGWFYTLLVLSTAILDKAPYRNVVCTGMVLDEDGNKLSKRLSNYEDPNVILGEFGADIIRVYFVKSPLMRAEPLNFTMSSITRLKNRFVPYVNAFKFMIEHTLNYMTTVDDGSNVRWGDSYFKLESNKVDNLMDAWLLNRMIEIAQQVNHHIRAYRMGQAIDLLVESIEELTNWYLKLNRDRLKGSEGESEQKSSLSTLYTVLLTYTQLWAPFTPFLSEYLFQRLKSIHVSPQIRSAQSVLLTSIPSFEADYVDQNTLTLMKDMQRVCTMVRTIRTTSENHSSRMVAFKSCTISHANSDYLKRLEFTVDVIRSELNVMKFKFDSLANNVELKVRFNNKEVGITFKRDAKTVKELIEAQSQELLYQLYSENVGAIEVEVNSEKQTFEYPSKFFELYAVPKEAETDSTVQVDLDLMVKVDPTYDRHINYGYQLTLLRSAIQKARKVMKLRPWHTVTVMVDHKFVDATQTLYDAEQLAEYRHARPKTMTHDLRHMLPEDTTNIVEVKFTDKDLAGFEIGGVREANESVVFLDKFDWNMLGDETVSGYFCVHHRYLKLDD